MIENSMYAGHGNYLYARNGGARKDCLSNRSLRARKPNKYVKVLPDFAKMTVGALKDWANAHSIALPGKGRKADIIAAIEANA